MSRKVAYLVARGLKNPEIAAKLEVSVDRVKTLKRSPLFMEMVALLEEQITDATRDVVKELADDAGPNLDFIRSVRDGSFEDMPDRMNVRLRASSMLFERQAPIDKDNIDRAVTVVLSAGLVTQMVRAMKATGGTVPGVIDIPPAAENSAPNLRTPISLDDLRAREAAGAMKADAEGE